jgi:hypothetical protein
MFEFMTSELRRPAPKTVQELKERGYELHSRIAALIDFENIIWDKNLR